MPNVSEVEQLLRKKALRVLRVHSRSMSSEIYGVLEEARFGRGVHYPNNPNPSSVPGDPPARQTGRLMESVKVIDLNETTLTALVGPDPRAFPDAYYPALLEFGTRDIGPRMFMRPAVERYRAAIQSGTGRP